MRPVFLTAIVVALFGASAGAQQHPVSLKAFFDTRSSVFRNQHDRAMRFSSLRKRPLFFTDGQKNHVLMTGVTERGIPVYRTTLNAGAAITTGAVACQPGGAAGLNIQGENMIVGVWDGGIVKDHIELGTRILSRQGPVQDTHATHVTGTLIATGINPLAKGMAPLAKATTWYFDNDEATMAALARPDETSLLISNHSYGTATGWFKNNGVWQWTGDSTINKLEDYRFGFYGDRAQSLDELANLAPYYTIVWAAGNDRADVGNGSKPVDCNAGTGYDCIIPESVAKNIITVGAVNKVPTYTNPSSVVMSFFSSWGPTDDGRIKPDITGAGVDLFSLSAAGTNTYTTLSGTSMATPNVAGSILLMQELYSKLHGGHFMKASTLKALAIHTAKEAGNFPGPDYSFGWGLLDVAAGAQLLMNQDEQNIFVDELDLQNGQTYAVDLLPVANKKITATIVWTDPAAMPVADALDPTNLMLVNDLDLRITDPSGQQTFPWILDPANPSGQATTGDNFRDNVERLEFIPPQSNTYHLTINHKKNLAGGHQKFSLIISYTAKNAAKTFYWINNAGDWSDGNHWAASTGGTSVHQTPTANDRVIFDNNSFSGAGSVSLSQDVACSSFVWMCTQPATLALNAKTLSVSQQMSIGSSAFATTSSGFIHFNSGARAGTLSAISGSFSGTTLFFDGAWGVSGDFSTEAIQINSGTVDISSSTISAGNFNTSSRPSAIHLTSSDITISNTSTMAAATTTITAVNSTITSGASSKLNWQGIIFPGNLIVPAGNAMEVDGDNFIAVIYNKGKLLLSGSNLIDTLSSTAASRMDLAAGTMQTASFLDLSGTTGAVTTLSSSSGSTIKISTHHKFCFDFLAVTNVSVTGLSRVNAGLYSTLTNSLGWLSQDCSDVLFADFNVQYPCANGLTTFTSTSSGDITSMRWRAVPNFSDSATFRHQFITPGNYPVSLLVRDASGTDSVQQTINILPNTLPANEIALAGQTLTSLQTSPQYQWYHDNVSIAGANDRSFKSDGQSGIYFVVTSDGTCNQVSEALIIAGVDGQENAQLYPNPASTFFKLQLPSGNISVSVVDLMGSTVMEQSGLSGETIFQTGNIRDGVYIIVIRSDTSTWRRKIIIQH